MQTSHHGLNKKSYLSINGRRLIRFLPEKNHRAAHTHILVLTYKGDKLGKNLNHSEPLPVTASTLPGSAIRHTEKIPPCWQ